MGINVPLWMATFLIAAVVLSLLFYAHREARGKKR